VDIKGDLVDNHLTSKLFGFNSEFKTNYPH
jgi:hypothetical protein